MEDEEHLLTFYTFPPVMHRYIRSTNAIESFFSNVRQRTDQIDAFTTETSCLTIVWAVMQDIRLPKDSGWLKVERSLRLASKQPARKAGSGGGGVCRRSCVTTMFSMVY